VPTLRPIPERDRLIFALDVPDVAAARALVHELGDALHFYKLGLELASRPGYFELVEELAKQGKRLFLDLKLHDIPATVGRAVKNLARLGDAFLTVHAEGAACAAAAREKADLRILAVTLLTSTGEAELRELGYPAGTRAESIVLDRARVAIRSGCDGVIASPLEAAALRRALGPEPLIVTPGIRPSATSVAGDDQSRAATPADAFRAGADHIVVGRPIRDASDPRAAALAIRDEIRAAL
jgi:orotidine-5'-phosphate decarboxylase